jgi:3-hydroxy-9,10-secoandrosta-1,3,5(10)-triene-9,17-dione monooxygenase
MSTTKPLATAADAPSQDVLRQRARELVPVLRERSAADEGARRMSDATQQAFLDAGFYRILQPRPWGGFEMDYTMSVDIAAELGRGCGSAAWIFTNLAQQAMVNGMKSPAAQEDIWADGSEGLCASAFPGREARITRVDGGFEVDGVWNYASGLDFAAWVNLQLFLRPEDGPAEHRFASVHKSNFEVIDDWFVTGLAATGSRSLRLNKHFIPDHHTISSLEVQGGPTPGSAVSDGVLYRLPFWGVASRLFSGPILGMARGALEVLEEDLEARVSVGGAKLAEEPIVHLRLAESGGEINAAGALIRQDVATATAMTEAGKQPTLIERAGWRRNNAYAVLMCLRAVDRLHDLAGMRGMAEGHFMQRAWRDAHAGASQVAIAWDTQAMVYGRARFGLPLRDPRA